MANYNLVVNSKFQPFSFERYIQPYQMYGEAYKEVENALGELATKANVWEEMANEQADPYAYKMYKTYANDLEEQAGQLAREGLNAASRRNMLNMRARYSKEITPIEQAYAARQKQAEEQQKALLQDPTLMLSRRAATTSLDDYIRNPQLAYESYSGKLITAQVASAASALAKEMQEQPRKWRSILGNSYYETMMQKGFSSQAVLQAIQGNPNAAPQLAKIVEDAVDSSGVRGWRDQDTIARAIDYANQGLWSAVGETQYQTLDDWRAKLAEQEDAQIRAEERKRKEPKKLAINPLNIYSSRELSKEEQTYRDNVEKYSNYFYTDKQGRVRLTEDGLKEYRRNATPRVTTGGSGGGTARLINAETQIAQTDRPFTPTPFKKFLDSIGGSMKMEEGAGWNSRRIGSLWKNYVDNDPVAKTAKYDATKVTEFGYDIGDTEKRDIKDKIMTASRGLSLKEVDYNNKSKQFEDTGEEITMEDFENDKYEVVDTRFSPYGNTVMIKVGKGEVKRFRMPAGINTYNEGFRDAMMADVLEYQELLKNPNLSLADRLAYQDAYEEAIQMAYLYHSQLGVQNKTKEQEFNPYGY